MTPAVRRILATLADVYEEMADSHAHASGYGPYGRAAERLGVPASRVAAVEDETVGWSGIFTDYRAEAARIRRHIG